jgi:hypothetical protein
MSITSSALAHLSALQQGQCCWLTSFNAEKHDAGRTILSCVKSDCW